MSAAPGRRSSHDARHVRDPTDGSRYDRGKARPMALRTGIDFTKALRLAEGLEDEETVLEMSAGR